MKPALFLVALLLPGSVLAATIDANALAAAANQVPPLTISISPLNPRPNGVVTITPESTLLELTNAVITIVANGKQVYTGSAQPISLTLPSPGNTSIIKVTALTQGKTYTATAALKPGDVSLIEEPLSSAPALYPGKPLLPDSGSVRLVAIADFETSPGHQINPALLSYSWSSGGSTLVNISGLGRSTVVLPTPLKYRTERVTVTVTSQDGSMVGSDTVALSPQDTVLRLYESNPLQGVLYDRALTGAYKITNSEITLFAAPFSFALDNGTPSIQWYVSGNASQGGSAITLRPSGEGGGSASVSAAATSPEGDITAATALSLTFGTKSSSFFGL